MVFAGIGDRIEARPAEAFALEIGGPFGAGLPTGAENLVLRAAMAASPEAPAHFSLLKSLPPASGIGGGSSDAAAAIRAVLRLRDPGADPARLTEGLAPGLAAQLGADVPVCLTPRPTRMRGIGEQLDPVAGFPPGHVLLVNPRVEVPTPAVFRALARKTNPALPDRLPPWPDLTALASWLTRQRNDLEPPATALTPVIGAVLSALRGCPGQLIARMSGSGATCFALFSDAAVAQASRDTIRAAYPDWWAEAGPLLT